MAFDSTPDYAWSVVQRIYAEVTSQNGYNPPYQAGSDERNDLENRIRDGQGMAEITANTYDDARRRFPPNVRPNVEDTITRDAQANAGVQYQAPAQLVAAVVAAAPAPPQLVQAAAVGPAGLESDLSSGPGGPIGVRSGGGGLAPSSTRYSSTGGTFNLGGGGGAGGGLFGFDMTTLLIIGAVGVGAWLLLRKKG